MSWTSPRTWSIGELVTKVIMDTHIRDNLLALWVGTTAGDTEYYTSSTAKSRVAKGTGGQLYTMDSTATFPECKSLFTGRKGGSTTNWHTAGTTNYTPTKFSIQVGTADIPADAGNDTCAATVTFPVAFTYIPIIFMSVQYSGANYAVSLSHLITNTTNFLAVVHSPERVNRVINWMAIGE